MHAGDDAVGGDDEIESFRHAEDGGVVGEAEGAGVGGERPEMSRDQALLRRGVGSGHGPYPPAARSAPADVLVNSPARSCRARWSSTALTMPVSSSSTKAPATSTYSEVTTRAGTSLRQASS